MGKTEYMKEWRAENKKHYQTYSKEYREKHKDKMRKYKKEYNKGYIYIPKNKIEKKYTLKDLEKLHQDYEYNFEKLINAVGTPKHNIYVVKENRLNKLNDKILFDCGIPNVDPCPIKANYRCEECSGIYKKLGKEYKLANINEKYFKICKLKNIKKLLDK